MTESKRFPATVVRVIAPHKVVINRGTEHGIQKGQRFLVYHLDTTPIQDPETGSDLGRLEIVRGTGKATHVQEKMTTVSSDRRGPSERRVKSKLNPFSTQEETQTPGDIEPFEDVERGDKAKPL